MNETYENKKKFYFQNVQKVQKIIGIMKKTTVKFLPKSDQKNNSSQFLRGSEATAFLLAVTYRSLDDI